MFSQLLLTPMRVVRKKTIVIPSTDEIIIFQEAEIKDIFLFITLFVNKIQHRA